MKDLFVSLSLSLALLSAGCSPDIDKKKFEPAAKAALAVQAAIDNMDDYETFGKVFDTLANELISLRDTVSSEKEKQLLASYTELLMTYQDGFQLWEYKVESARYSWVPEGKIYLEPKIKAIALKYHLPIESHVVELTHHAWKSVPADSLKKIWERAREQLRKIRS